MRHLDRGGSLRPSTAAPTEASKRAALGGVAEGKGDGPPPEERSTTVRDAGIISGASPGTKCLTRSSGAPGGETLGGGGGGGGGLDDEESPLASTPSSRRALAAASIPGSSRGGGFAESSPPASWASAARERPSSPFTCDPARRENMPTNGCWCGRSNPSPTRLWQTLDRSLPGRYCSRRCCCRRKSSVSTASSRLVLPPRRESGCARNPRLPPSRRPRSETGTFSPEVAGGCPPTSKRCSRHRTCLSWPPPPPPPFISAPPTASSSDPSSDRATDFLMDNACFGSPPPLAAEITTGGRDGGEGIRRHSKNQDTCIWHASCSESMADLPATEIPDKDGDDDGDDRSSASSNYEAVLSADCEFFLRGDHGAPTVDGPARQVSAFRDTRLEQASGWFFRLKSERSSSGGSSSKSSDWAIVPAATVGIGDGFIKTMTIDHDDGGGAGPDRNTELGVMESTSGTENAVASPSHLLDGSHRDLGLALLTPNEKSENRNASNSNNGDLPSCHDPVGDRSKDFHFHCSSCCGSSWSRKNSSGSSGCGDCFCCHFGCGCADEPGGGDNRCDEGSGESSADSEEFFLEPDRFDLAYGGLACLSNKFLQSFP